MLKTYNLSRDADTAPAFPDRFTVVRYAVLNRSDLIQNNNKFYVLELHEAAAAATAAGQQQYRLFTHYGRVGTAGVREARFADERAMLDAEFERILKEKTGPKKGYVPVDVAKAVVGSDTLQAETERKFVETRGVRASALDPAIARFVEHIYD